MGKSSGAAGSSRGVQAGHEGPAARDPRGVLADSRPARRTAPRSNREDGQRAPRARQGSAADRREIRPVRLGVRRGRADLRAGRLRGHAAAGAARAPAPRPRRRRFGPAHRGGNEAARAPKRTPRAHSHGRSGRGPDVGVAAGDPGRPGRRARERPTDRLLLQGSGARALSDERLPSAQGLERRLPARPVRDPDGVRHRAAPERLGDHVVVAGLSFS